MGWIKREHWRRVRKHLGDIKGEDTLLAVHTRDVHNGEPKILTFRAIKLVRQSTRSSN